MSRPITLFTGQWADLPLETLARKAARFGYDGLELACWGDHFDVRAALADDGWCERQWTILTSAGLSCYAVSNHLVGQAVCDVIDERHRSILPEHVWGDGEPEGVRTRAAEEMKDTARAARRFFDAAPDEVKECFAGGLRTVVNGFTGSSIWHLLYAFPPVSPELIEEGYADFARRWTDILDAFDAVNVDFGLEVHPTEIAFDVFSTRRALAAIAGHPRFGFNYDPSHFAYQNVDYVGFLREFADRIYHVHVKDAWWSDQRTAIGTFGGHADFGDSERAWDFRSPGRGRVDFEAIARELNRCGYAGPLSVEWEDPGMDREFGAAEAASFARSLDYPSAGQAFDAAFSE